MWSKMKKVFGRRRKIRKLQEQVVLQTILKTIERAKANGICHMTQAYPLLMVHEMDPSCVDDADDGQFWVMAYQLVEWCIDHRGCDDRKPVWYKVKKHDEPSK